MGGCLASPPSTPGQEEAGEAFPSSRSARCVAFQSQQQDVKRPYLRYDAQGGAASGSRPLRLNGEGVASPYTRFYLEPASREHHGLVHIRCCYDSRYWAAQQRAHDGSWVVGTADEVEEDLSRPTCTLFRTMRVHPSGSIRLLHVHLEKYLCLPSSAESDTMIELQAVNPSLHKGDEQDAPTVCTFTVHDLSEQFVLPRYLAFIGDNDKYLRTRTMERHQYLEFSGHDVRDEAVLNTVHTNDDGTFRVRSNFVGKFWRRSPNWIWADSDGDATDSSGDTLFRVIRLSGAGGFLALQNLGNNYFCKRLTTEGKRNCLNAGTPTVTADARLRLQETVVSREICNVEFDLSNSRIYGRSSVSMTAASALNGTTSNNTAELALEYTDPEKRMMTWGSSVTLKSNSVATSICAGIPVIVADGSVEVSSPFSRSCSWGLPVPKETVQKVSYEVTVPPKTRVTVASTATRASCEVPFSYTQRDTLFDGRQVTYDMDDGLYTGVDCYDFKHVTSEEKYEPHAS
ncbi:uncharacterized protein LOC133887739 [Phragmites australis]|uniref:uncharacterized protein LOC133887739 n=1 Tax=Phragmites australis TaxID=29695 RepID=UPI002D78C35E|nr:uncharacterized protein LOC133887739 [Phragmites australis]